LSGVRDQMTDDRRQRTEDSWSNRQFVE